MDRTKCMEYAIIFHVNMSVSLAGKDRVVIHPENRKKPKHNILKLGCLPASFVKLLIHSD